MELQLLRTKSVHCLILKVDLVLHHVQDLALDLVLLAQGLVLEVARAPQGLVLIPGLVLGLVLQQEEGQDLQEIDLLLPKKGVQLQNQKLFLLTNSREM